jgi:hypothetical protein
VDVPLARLRAGGHEVVLIGRRARRQGHRVPRAGHPGGHSPSRLVEDPRAALRADPAGAAVTRCGSRDQRMTEA